MQRTRVQIVGRIARDLSRRVRLGQAADGHPDRAPDRGAHGRRGRHSSRGDLGAAAMSHRDGVRPVDAIANRRPTTNPGIPRRCAGRCGSQVDPAVGGRARSSNGTLSPARTIVASRRGGSMPTRRS